MKSKVEIYFGGDLVHLYEVGYITTDLYQLNSFGNLLEERNEHMLERFFGERPTPINRYTGIKSKKMPRSEIIEVRPGSVLIIAQVTLAAAIIMPIVSIYVAREFKRRDCIVQFEISPQDPELKRVLDAYDEGEFGFDDLALKTLFSVLQNKNYDVHALSDNSYRINNVTKKYAQRMVRTINKYRR